MSVDALKNEASLAAGVGVWQSDLVTVAAVLGLLFAVILYNNARATRARRPTPTGTHASKDPMVGRFVHHDGDVVGEVIALDGDQAILLQGHVYRAIPQARLLPAGDELVITGTVNWGEAEEKARAWRKGG